jgi:hypothetical protein
MGRAQRKKARLPPSFYLAQRARLAAEGKTKRKATRPQLYLYFSSSMIGVRSVESPIEPVASSRPFPTEVDSITVDEFPDICVRKLMGYLIGWLYGCVAVRIRIDVFKSISGFMKVRKTGRTKIDFSPSSLTERN